MYKTVEELYEQVGLTTTTLTETLLFTYFKTSSTDNLRCVYVFPQRGKTKCCDVIIGLHHLDSFFYMRQS